ncbi:hypothetical protein HDU84_008852, partial [Entophlyctis sp. JEL0112]
MNISSSHHSTYTAHGRHMIVSTDFVILAKANETLSPTDGAKKMRATSVIKFIDLEALCSGDVGDFTNVITLLKASKIFCRNLLNEQAFLEIQASGRALQGFTTTSVQAFSSPLISAYDWLTAVHDVTAQDTEIDAMLAIDDIRVAMAGLPSSSPAAVSEQNVTVQSQTEAFRRNDTQPQQSKASYELAFDNSKDRPGRGVTTKKNPESIEKPIRKRTRSFIPVLASRCHQQIRDGAEVSGNKYVDIEQTMKFSVTSNGTANSGYDSEVDSSDKFVVVRTGNQHYSKSIGSRNAEHSASSGRLRSPSQNQRQHVWGLTENAKPSSPGFPGNGRRPSTPSRTTASQVRPARNYEKPWLPNSSRPEHLASKHSPVVVSVEDLSSGEVFTSNISGDSPQKVIISIDINESLLTRKESGNLQKSTDNSRNTDKWRARAGSVSESLTKSAEKQSKEWENDEKPALKIKTAATQRSRVSSASPEPDRSRTSGFQRPKTPRSKENSNSRSRPSTPVAKIIQKRSPSVSFDSSQHASESSVMEDTGAKSPKPTKLNE